MADEAGLVIPIDTATGRQAGSRVHTTLSLDLYSTALVWYGPRHGSAKLHGRQVQLTAAPDLPGSRVVMVDYRPEIGERRIQRFDGPATDMTPDEVAAADALLQRLCGPV